MWTWWSTGGHEGGSDGTGNRSDDPRVSSDGPGGGSGCTGDAPVVFGFGLLEPSKGLIVLVKVLMVLYLDLIYMLRRRCTCASRSRSTLLLPQNNILYD